MLIKLAHWAFKWPKYACINLADVWTVSPGASFSLPQHPIASTLQAVPGFSLQSDAEPLLTQPSTPKFQPFLRPPIRNLKEPTNDSNFW